MHSVTFKIFFGFFFTSIKLDKSDRRKNGQLVKNFRIAAEIKFMNYPISSFYPPDIPPVLIVDSFPLPLHLPPSPPNTLTPVAT